MPAWGDGILRARWGDRAAAVIQGPALVDPAALSLARQRCASCLDPQSTAVLPLLGVVRVRGREGWVYERPRGVSIAVLLAKEGSRPPPAVAAEIVARTAEALLSLGELGSNHPGPLPRDVLVDEQGMVMLAGLVGPEEPGSRRVPPNDDPAPEEALVWGLGTLLAWLLVGRKPMSAAQAGTEAVYQRRLMVGLLARGGDQVPEDLQACLMDALAWDRADRVRLSDLPARLRGSRGVADVAGWAGDVLPAVRRRLEAQWEIPDGESHHTLTEADPEEITEESEASFVLGDMLEEVTAASAGRAGWPRDVPEHGAIPVLVGPPAEAVTGPHRLPAELFDEDGVTRTVTVGPRTTGLVVVSIALAMLAALLTAYIVAG